MNETQRRELYKHLGCNTVPSVTEALKYQAQYGQTYGLQAKADRVVAYYEKHRVFCTTQKEMITRIRNEWTAGLGPIASWLMWMAIKTLVTQVVRWLWSRYTP